MKITALNLDIKWKSPLENLVKIEKKFENQTADLFLLPEMFATGFCVDSEEIVDQNGKIMEWMKDFIQKKNSALAGSVAVKDNGEFYNRFYFVKPNGEVSFYDKRHLFSHGGEGMIYTAGQNRVVVNYLGVRILLLVCYDLRFPVFARNQNDYDIILCVANWPESRILAWKTLLKARAIENQAFVFGVNRIGIDGNHLYYPESSYCFFADGTEISEKEGNIITAKVNLEKLQNFREKFNFLKDADMFNLL